MIASMDDVEESIVKLSDVWGEIVRERGGDVADRPGMAIRWADSHFPFWNCVALTDRNYSPARLSKCLADVVSYMRRSPQSGHLWLFEDLLNSEARGRLSTIARAAGLVFSLKAYGMAGDFLPIDEPVRSDITFVRVETEPQLIAFADLNARAYGMPLEAGRDGLHGSRLWKSAYFSYLALADGVPVAAAASIPSGDCLFLALVATAPEAQRRGFGEAVVRKALYEGARATGIRRSVLHATEAGAPVYERIGYRKVASMSLYGLK